MVSIIDAFKDACTDQVLYLKIALYAIPAYFCLTFFTKGQMLYFYILGSISAILYAGLLAHGVCNIHTNRIEILTLNPMSLIKTILKMLAVIVPQILVYYILGILIIQNVQIPLDFPYVQLIFAIMIWSIFGAIVFTAYLSFARRLSIKSGYNYLEILPVSLSVFISILFAIPQFLVLNFILVGFVGYLFWFFQIELTHWGFIAYCSIIFAFNIPMLSDYFAQIEYEHFKYNRDDDADTQLNYVIKGTDTERTV